MWNEISLEETPEEFQERINTFINFRENSELLKTIAASDDNNEIYKYSCYLFWGNVCTVISMWSGGVLHGNFSEDSMIIGELKEFIKHPKLQFWFS